ncbi:hypothetical protein [Pseudoalteromonas umbrosa]|uniref:hypothetical protein n=1 Tax=Pseudoalteromonas umbrosa TaxID=3048489 RepID=UPI0024C2737D|nr:hypothetical protein [Pseudoalteromonas sp. B95]MDK1290154.1 hypothetical protein [Pseudoalteromonas sp. B95]
MSQRDLFVDAFELPETKYEIHEALEASVSDDSPNAGVVDGENILARVVGPFFLVDGKSRNGRYYTRELWEKAIERNSEQMANGTMLGTIGHSQKLDDEALLQGLASHRVARLWIDDDQGVGMGEILVLNTPSGRALNAYLRGGVQFPVSSRGYGGFRNEKRDNAPVIDENSFELETFDFVRVQGVPIAIPKLVESLDKEATKIHTSLLGEATDPQVVTADPSTPSEEREMSANNTAATISALARQKAQVETDLTASYAENEELRSTNEKLTNTVSELEAQVTDVNATNEELAKYQALGTVEAIAEVFDRYNVLKAEHAELVEKASTLEAVQAELAAYKALGTVEAIEGALSVAEKFLDDNEASIDEALSVTEQYAQLGTVEEINAALDLLEAYQAVATPAELEEATELLAQYIELGTVSQIEELIERAEQMAESIRQQQFDAQVAELASETNAPTDIVAEMLESFGEEQARDMLVRLASHAAAEQREEDVVEVEAPAQEEEAVEEQPEQEADDVETHDADENDADDEDDQDTDEDEDEKEDEVIAESAPRRSRAGSLTETLMNQFSPVSVETLELSEEDISAEDNSINMTVGSLFESCN